jgi:predicted TIM-barrel fold metal-dependent hydrolase
MTIWDLHCHLTAEGSGPLERFDALLRYADRMGIERVCIYLGIRQPGGRARDPSPENLRRQNDEILSVLDKRSDRAFGFVYLNPNHVEFSVDELNRCVADGPMVGVKLWTALKCNAPELDPIVSRATELKSVVFQHTWLKVGGNPLHSGGGNLPGESTPMNVAELARRHPRARLICGHAGGDWELGIRAVRAYPNVALGLAGFDPTNGVTEMAVRELGPDRVLYGSDAAGRSFASQLAKVFGADIPDDQKQMILSGNLQRRLQPILDQKGIKP